MKKIKYLLIIIIAINFTSCTSDNNIPLNKNIKGNISSSGEKIYHMPDGQYYDQTNAEEYFATEQEAKEAGYRRAKR